MCVKFPPQAVDEVFLRRLAERFGPVTQVLMFPSLVSLRLWRSCSWRSPRLTVRRPLQAFMELGSAQQAHDLVQFHQEEPPTVQGQPMEFRVSHTFSFPQVRVAPPTGLLRTWSGWLESL